MKAKVKLSENNNCLVNKNLFLLESDFCPEEDVARPELLFNDNEDLEGQQIFAFRTPKKRNALTNIAESAKTPKIQRQKLKKGKSINLFPVITIT